MKILIDIGHPAHVHYFKNLIRRMHEKGHQFLIIARDKEITHQLLQAYDLAFVSRGRGKNNLLGKILYTLRADVIILRNSLQWKPDLFLSFGSPYAAHISWLTGKPHIAITDTEHARLGILAFLPFTRTVLTPDVFQKDFGAKHVRFNSYVEFTYLHPNYFVPELNIKRELGLGDHEKFVMFRYISWGASHDIGQSGIPDVIKKELIQLFIDKGYKILISAEGALDAFFEPYKIAIAPHKIHSVIQAADFFIGESGTMATEAAILGTPSVFVSSLNAGVFEDEEKHGLLYSFRSATGLMEKVTQLLSDSKLKARHIEQKEKLKNDKINLTDFLVWFFENYPESISIVKNDQFYQNRFK